MANVKKNINIKKIKIKPLSTIKRKEVSMGKFNNKKFNSKTKIEKRISQSRKTVVDRSNLHKSPIKKTGGCNCNRGSSSSR